MMPLGGRMFRKRISRPAFNIFLKKRCYKKKEKNEGEAPSGEKLPGGV
jgi:hypothetical protein